MLLERMKQNLTKFRSRLINGEELRLDAEHQQMAHHIYNDFDHLYPSLLAYYNQTIDKLKCADAIKKLRQQHYETTGIVAPEPEPSYAIVANIKGFWDKLNRLLIY